MKDLNLKLKYISYFKGVVKYSDCAENIKIGINIYFENYDNIYPKCTDRFCEYSIPTEVLKNDLQQILYEEGFMSFEEYHEDFKKRHQIRVRDKILPLFLDETFGCIIEDGWTRFHSYVEQGIEIIPCLFLD